MCCLDNNVILLTYKNMNCSGLFHPTLSLSELTFISGSYMSTIQLLHWLDVILSRAGEHSTCSGYHGDLLSWLTKQYIFCVSFNWAIGPYWMSLSATNRIPQREPWTTTPAQTKHCQSNTNRLQHPPQLHLLLIYSPLYKSKQVEVVKKSKQTSAFKSIGNKTYSVEAGCAGFRCPLLEADINCSWVKLTQWHTAQPQGQRGWWRLYLSGEAPYTVMLYVEKM